MTDDIECPLTANPCRHCSDEHVYRPYTKLEKDPRNGLFKPAGIGKLKINLGHYCNNVCCWCEELESCPMPDDLIRQGEMIEENKLDKERERVKEERRKARKKVVKKPVAKKVVKKPIKKLIKNVVIKDVNKRKL